MFCMGWRAASSRSDTHTHTILLASGKLRLRLPVTTQIFKYVYCMGMVDAFTRRYG